MIFDELSPHRQTAIKFGGGFAVTQVTEAVAAGVIGQRVGGEAEAGDRKAGTVGLRQRYRREAAAARSG